METRVSPRARRAIEGMKVRLGELVGAYMGCLPSASPPDEWV
jgi:hypothetical protein